MNQQIINNCKRMLEDKPEFRELVNIRKAIWFYWTEFCGIRHDHITYDEFMSGRIPNLETLASAFRTVKRKYPHLRGTKASQDMQRERSNQFKTQFGYPAKRQDDASIERERRIQQQMRID